MKHVVRVLALTAAWAFACSSSPLGLSVSVPSDLTDSAEWYEVAAYEGTACQALLPMLPGGAPGGYTARIAWEKGNAPPSFGNVPNSNFAFGAVARDKNCAIIATGCTQVDAGHADAIAIATGAVDTPRGACEAGASCQAGACVPANDNSDPSVGAGCSLELLGSGPLANSSGQDGTIVSAPGIVSLGDDAGFLISYREVDTSGARLVVLPVDNSGGSQQPKRPALPTCNSIPYQADGVGMLLDGQNGFITFSGCSTSDNAPALDLEPFNPTSGENGIPGEPTLSGSVFVSGSTTQSTTAVTLGAARPATLRDGGNLMVFTQAGSARIATMDPTNGVGAPSGSFGEQGVTGAWIAANSTVLALMSVGPGDPNPGGDPDPAPGDDDTTGDDDDGDGGTGTGVPTVDSGLGPLTTLRLLLLDPSTDITTIQAGATPEITFPGTFGSIAATGGRVLVVADSGESATQSVTYHAFDYGSAKQSDSNGFGVDSPGATSPKVTAADVAILGDRAFFVALETGQVALNVYDHATTTLTPLRNVSFSDLSRISGISTVRDGSVSVAVSSSRIGVVWTTAKTLTSNDADGGYAVFACTQ